MNILATQPTSSRYNASYALKIGERKFSPPLASLHSTRFVCSFQLLSFNLKMESVIRESLKRLKSPFVWLGELDLEFLGVFIVY